MPFDARKVLLPVTAISHLLFCSVLSIRLLLLGFNFLLAKTGNSELLCGSIVFASSLDLQLTLLFHRWSSEISFTYASGSCTDE